jgi:hypothetical protein
MRGQLGIFEQFDEDFHPWQEQSSFSRVLAPPDRCISTLTLARVETTVVKEDEVEFPPFKVF